MPFKDYIVDIVWLSFSAGLGYTCYVFLKAGEEVLQILKVTPDIDINSQLINEVGSCGDAGLVACVRGAVRAAHTPIKALSRPEVTGVVWKHTIKEHLVAQIMGFWMNDERTLGTSTSSVPFLLMNKGIGVNIAEPNSLEDIDLQVMSEKFEAAHNSFADHLWGWMKGIRSTGTQQTEEMLVEGTQVMGIGRLMLREDALHLDHAQALPYIVTTQDKNSLLKDWAGPLPVLKVLVVVSFFGVSFYSYRMIKRWWQRYRKARKRRVEVQEIEDARERREANDLPESLMCVVCCGLRDVVFHPCQHVCVCGECSLRLNPRICPVCRTPIERIQPVFYS